MKKVAFVIFFAILTAFCVYQKATKYKFYIKLDRWFTDEQEYKLAKAVRRQNVLKIKKICKQHPELIQKSYEEKDYSVLHLAAEEGRIKSIKALLDAGMNVNVQNKHNHTPLYSVSGFCFATFPPMDYSDVIEMLVEKGADCNIKAYYDESDFKEEETPLMNASRYYVDKVKLLVEIGNADVNAKNENGKTAAVVALWKNKIECAHYLICECKANVKEPFVIYKYPQMQLYPVMLLRKFSFEPGTEEYKMLEEIKQEFRNQGINNFDEEISENAQNVINESLPAEWENFFK